MGIPLTKEQIGDARAVRVEGGFMRRMSTLLQRAGLGALFGQAFQGKRDYYEVFGYDREVDLNKMWMEYHRGGIAHSIIHAYPDTLWGRAPELYVQGNETWNKAWDKFVKQFSLWKVVHRADILAGLGRYSVILVGTQTANMAIPMRKGSRITYLQPFSELNVQISEWERDPTSERFGMPKFYTIYPNRNRNRVETGDTLTGPVASSFRVHHSRIIHITHGGLESQVYGIPRLVPIWNYLMDLTKIVGSSAESYWMTAYQGLHIDVDKEMEMEAGDAQDLSDEAEEYQHGLRRIIRTRGVKVEQLGSKVADPKGAFDVVVTLISGTTRIPKRVFLGSEAGQLASSQDKATWAERIEEERDNHATPDVIVPLLKFMRDYEIMEMPVEDIDILWPDAYRMSPLERGQTSSQTARTAINLMRAMEPVIIKKGTLATIGPNGETIPGTPDETGEPLITRDEARAIIGLSTDQQALVETPE